MRAGARECDSLTGATWPPSTDRTLRRRPSGIRRKTPETPSWWADLLGITDVVSFHADNVTELRAAFEEAVDDDLDTCKQLGKPPQQPAGGKLMLRVPPEIHRAALVAAQAAGTSLNQWAAKVLAQAAR